MTCRHGSPSDKCRICTLEKELADQKEEYNRACEAIGFIEEGQKVLKDQIKSLKAITELAVKGLRWYADKKNWNLSVHISMGSAFPLHEAIKSDKGKIAIDTLSEIERLQSEQT